jgi:hypothetical protein
MLKNTSFGTNAHVEADLMESQKRNIMFEFPIYLEGVRVFRVFCL